MRKSTNGNLKRRNLMFPDSFDEQLAEVRARTGAQSDSEVLRLAFQVYRTLLEEDGECVIRDNAGNEKSVLIPAK